MSQGTEAEARERLRAVKGTLKSIVERDPEQEVQGMALPVLDAVVAQARAWRPSDPVLDRVSDVISPAAVEAGEPIRAVDALLVVDLLFSTLKPRRMPRSPGF